MRVEQQEGSLFLGRAGQVADKADVVEGPCTCNYEARTGVSAPQIHTLDYCGQTSRGGGKVTRRVT